MTDPELDQSSPDSPTESPRHDWRWWVALGCALAFMVGAAGYFISHRTSTRTEKLSAVDIGFMQDMIDHHDQAVVLSIYANHNATDPTVKDFTIDNLVFQRFEIGQMTELLRNQGLERGAEDRIVMDWMDMPMPLAEMPGLASDEEVEALATAEGDEANRLFLVLMREHHQGGIHMANYAAEHGNSARVRKLASMMARNQTLEVGEYTRTLKQLGFE